MNEIPKGKIIFDHTKGTREEWLALHDKHIGGSDAGAIMGLSPYTTPLSVYTVKTGLLPHKEENDYMRWGNLLEDLVRREFVKDFEAQDGRHIVVHDDAKMYESLDYPFMCADPDGFVSIEEPAAAGGNLTFALLEIKTTTRAQARYWKDDTLPDWVFAQVQHNMFVFGLPLALVVCLMDKKILWRVVPEAKTFMTEMVRMEKRFWEDFVLPGKIPAPSGEDIDTDILLDLFPKQEDVTVDLGQLPWVAKYLQAKEQMTKAKKEQEKAKQQILANMAGAYRAVAGEHKVTRVQFERPTFDLSAFRRDHPVLTTKYMKITPVDFPRIS